MAAVMFNMAQFEIAEHLDRGIFWLRKNHFAEAIAEFERVLEIDPTDRYARWNRVVARLSLGDYTNGFPEHQCAWEIYDWRALGQVQGNVDRILELVEWNGDRCDLLVYHEMGFGDAIMLLRFLPELVRRCESVTLVIRPELVSLMEGYGARILSLVPTDIHAFDARVTFFNAIHIMGHTFHTIPNKPYVPADFSSMAEGKIGIAWSGSSRKEFVHLHKFLGRLDTRNLKIFALQNTEQIEGVHQLQGDFKSTAKLMATLDHIVTIDTASAHLAGAIGHPSAHVILPFLRDWRWWNKNIWYPTLNIYPQDNPDDWDAPFARVNKKLWEKHDALCN